VEGNLLGGAFQGGPAKKSGKSIGPTEAVPLRKLGTRRSGICLNGGQVQKRGRETYLVKKKSSERRSLYGTLSKTISAAEKEGLGKEKNLGYRGGLFGVRKHAA